MERIANQWRNVYQLEYDIIENGQNAEKSHVNLRRLAVTQIPMTPLAKAGVKN